MTTTSPFDILAPTYDADFTRSRIGVLQRERVWQALRPVLQAAGRPLQVLEINCGTGHDALQLAALGHHVTATDASAEMICTAKEKATTGISGSVKFITCAFDELSSYFSEGTFDLIFSNFGGLNCVSRKGLQQLAGNFSALLKKDGLLFVVLLGRYCAWEMVYYSLRAKFNTAFRRFGSMAVFTIGNSKMPVYYYSPAQLKKICRPFFTAEKNVPIGLFIPPSYAGKSFSPKRLNRLSKLENKLGYGFLSGLADHYCCIFKKSSSL